MTDFSSGAVLDDDLDLGAAKGRAKARESVTYNLLRTFTAA